MPASYNGEFIFGITSEFMTSSPANRVQRNAYNGVNGYERLNLGSTGRITSVTGLMFDTKVNIQGAWVKWETYKISGGAYALVNNVGETYTNVVVSSFEWLEDYQPDRNNLFSRRYQATLEHLI